MDHDVFTGDWTKTKEAIANFRQLLLCSKCSKLMDEPVCLGVCEHMFCRSCAGPQAGAGCVVCGSPAWVKDIQINRQLRNITQQFCSLETLFHPTERTDSSINEPQEQSNNSVLKHKKNFKIWFSPRSRKVRCKVEKPVEVMLPDRKPAGEALPTQPEPGMAPPKDLSVFNFQTSSQDSGSASPQRGKNDNGKEKKKRATKKSVRRKLVVSCTKAHRQTRETMKKDRLETINQQWGFDAEEEGLGLGEGQQACAGKEVRSSSKRVSFLSSGEEPQDDGTQGKNPTLSPGRSILKAGLSGDSVSVSGNQEQPGPNQLAISETHSAPPMNVPESSEGTGEEVTLTPAKKNSKRSRVVEKGATPDTTPKRPRVSPGQRSRSMGRKVPSLSTPPSCLGHGRGTDMSGEERGGCLSSPASVARRSVGTPSPSGGRAVQGTPAFMKRNHKGETSLHLAAIKGDAEAVKELLEQGADPNLKDNAGWTPLHEACNLGHQAVVELLVLSGVLLNTPGYENDSPLHDAVRNGHTAIAKLLVQHGASQTALNLFGKRPPDYAVSVEMQAVFQPTSEAPRPAGTPASPPSSLSMMVSNGARQGGQVVLLATKLSQSQQKQLAKLGQLLGGKMAEGFSSSVSHVVVPDGTLPTTLPSLLGILRGCWVVHYSWVESCLQAGVWAPETEHEAGEGPRRSRVNKHSLLPLLFDGCFFFLLGSSFKAPPREELVQLVREGGGQLLSRRPKPDSDVTQTLSTAAYHALPASDQALCTQYILYSPRGAGAHQVVRRGKVWSAPATWLVDCVAAFRLLPVPGAQP